MDESSFAQVSCIVNKGDQPLSISWAFHRSNITSDLGIPTMPTGPRGSLLMIPSVEHKHRGTSTCKAANGAGVRSQSVELRVNGSIPPLASGKALSISIDKKKHLQWFHFSSTGHPTAVFWSKRAQRGRVCPSLLYCHGRRRAVDDRVDLPWTHVVR